MGKFREKFRKFWKYGFVWGSGGVSAHRKLAKILKKISRKINGHLQNFENFYEFLANFDLKKLILTKIEANFCAFGLFFNSINWS